MNVYFAGLRDFSRFFSAVEMLCSPGMNISENTFDQRASGKVERWIKEGTDFGNDARGRGACTLCPMGMSGSNLI